MNSDFVKISGNKSAVKNKKMDIKFSAKEKREIMSKINDANYPYFIQTKNLKNDKWSKPINDIDCMRIHFT